MNYLKPLQLQRLFLFNKTLKEFSIRFCNFIRQLDKEDY